MYDGSGFKHYLPENGMSFSHVNNLIESTRQPGTIYVGTNGGGVNIIRDGKISVLRVGSSIWSNRVNCLLEDVNGTIWLGTDAGIFLIRDGRVIVPIHRRVREYFGGDPTPQLLLDTPDEPLRAAGVSGNKIKALRDLAARTIDGTVPAHAAILKMSDADIVERLTEVRGIGSWTVEMLLIFRLGRPDVLPVTDYGVRKGFALTFQRVPKSRSLEAADLPKPDVVFRRGQRWAPYRSVASWYLWRACDLAKNAAPAGRSAR